MLHSIKSTSILGFKESDELDAPTSNLWVGNLAADVSDLDLIGLFFKYGALDSLITSAARSYAFVYFRRVEDAAAAKEKFQGAVFRGFPLKIEFARPAKPCKYLWVGGFSPAVSKEKLEELFFRFGKIEELQFHRDRNTAFIEYVKLEDASEAMRNMNGVRIGGDQIHVDFLRSQSLRRQPQIPGGHRDGLPSSVLWIGYPPSVQIDEQMLHNAMILFGEIERIKSFPSRHYSFVEFRSVDEARRAKEGLQGRLFNDPRITIMYSSSELDSGKEYSGFSPAVKVTRPEIFNEHILRPNQLEVLNRHRPIVLHTFPGPLPPSSVHRPNLPLRPFGPHVGFDAVLSNAEFNDLVPLHNFRDGNSNIPIRPNWRRPSPPESGILPSPISRIRPPMRSVSTGWDMLDPNQRDPKRSRIDQLLPIDNDSFASRKIDDLGLGLDKTYRLGQASDACISGPFINVQGKHSISPAGVKGIVGSHQRHPGNDYIWRGIIAKGGTPVCHARCVPIDKGIESELPEVVNCSARTGLDMLTKHYAEAIGFGIVFFLPDSEDDFASYTEFLRYLGSKNRAGVAKFDDGTTLFLVPPSDFLTKVLKVAGPERLYGVVLKLPQHVTSNASMQPQQQQPSHFPLYVDRPHIPSPESEYNKIREEYVMPLDYKRVLHEDSKPLSKSFYPSTTESISEQSVPQDYASNNPVAASQAGVSLTPELIATLASLLPANAQSTGLDVGQPLSGSVIRPIFSSVATNNGTSSLGWKQANQASGNTNHIQFGSQFNSQAQIQPEFQPHTSVSSGPYNTANIVPGNTQVHDSSINLPSQGGISSRPLTSVAMPAQSGQFVLSPQASQQYQLDVSYQKGYGGMVHGTDVSGSYSPSVIHQSSNPVTLSNQTKGDNHSQEQSGMPLSADKVNQQIPNQVQSFQNALPGADQVTSETEVDKNQRYQSTLQFAASLLLQIQQQTGNPAVRGSENQQ